MALEQSDVSALVDALRACDGVDLIRDLVRFVLQELVGTEASTVIGAGRYERSEGRTTERNGHRSKTLSTKGGDIEVAISKLRKGSYFPSFLESRRRIDQALYAVVMEAYVNGVSTRSLDDLVAALGVTSGISRSEVSRICARLDEAVEAFQTRRLEHARFPYVYLDATYLHVRCDHHVVSKAVVIATGIREDAHREVLGVDVGDSEDELFWRTGGLPNDLRPGHLRRDVFTVGSRARHVRRALRQASLMDTAKDEVLACNVFPRAHWRQIWSTSSLERLNKELKRRCKVVGIFPTESALIRLAGAVLRVTS